METQRRRKRLEDYFICYRNFKMTISKNRRLLIYNELVHIAYVFFLKIIKLFLFQKIKISEYENEAEVENRKKYLEDIFSKLKKIKKEYDVFHIYQKDLEYMFNLIENNITWEILQKDQKIISLFKIKEIVLSPFSYDNFLLLQNDPNFDLLKEFIVNSKIVIRPQVKNNRIGSRRP